MSTEQIPPDVVVMLKKMYPTGFATPWLLELQDVLDRNWIRQEDAGNRLKDRLNRSVVDILMKGHSMAYWDTFLYPNDRISSPLAVGLRGKVIQTRLQISGLIGKRVDWGASEDQAIKKLRRKLIELYNPIACC